MKHRTTIEIDDALLARARKTLGNMTTRATVEEALRRAANTAESDQNDQAERQHGYLERLRSHADVKILGSGEMWR
jgi:Arc/MetJ family transcription regulator